MQQYADLELSLHRYEAGTYLVGFRFTHLSSEADIGLGQKNQVHVQIDPQAKEFYPKIIDSGN